MLFSDLPIGKAFQFPKISLPEPVSEEFSGDSCAEFDLTPHFKFCVKFSEFSWGLLAISSQSVLLIESSHLAFPGNASVTELPFSTDTKPFEALHKSQLDSWTNRMEKKKRG